MHIPNYLARERKRHALSIREIAQFAGLHETTVGRVEAGQLSPPLELIEVSQFLFGLSASELFPPLVSRTRSRMLERLATFSIKVEQESGPAADQRRALLQEIADREGGEANAVVA